MVDQHTHLFASQHTSHTQLVAGAERWVGGDSEALVGHIQHLEVARVVEQAHIDATTVRAVVMHDLHAPRLDFGLLHQVLQHRNVLHFRHAHNHGTVWSGFGSHLADSVSQVMLFRPVFLMIPLASAVW